MSCVREGGELEGGRGGRSCRASRRTGRLRGRVRAGWGREAGRRARAGGGASAVSEGRTREAGRGVRPGRRGGGCSRACEGWFVSSKGREERSVTVVRLPSAVSRVVEGGRASWLLFSRLLAARERFGSSSLSAPPLGHAALVWPPFPHRQAGILRVPHLRPAHRWDRAATFARCAAASERGAWESHEDREGRGQGGRRRTSPGSAAVHGCCAIWCERGVLARRRRTPLRDRLPPGAAMVGRCSLVGLPPLGLHRQPRCVRPAVDEGARRPHSRAAGRARRRWRRRLSSSRGRPSTRP